MRLINTDPFDFKFVHIPEGSNDYKEGYEDGVKHVLEEMDTEPEVNAVPLDTLCEWLAKNTLEMTVVQPYTIIQSGVKLTPEEWKTKITKDKENVCGDV